FGLTGPDSHIINGHVPVKQIKGESPVRCGGKLLSIDGGFSKPYQKTTGIAGYTLTYNSYGMVLVAHEPFKSMMDAVTEETDVHSNKILEERVVKRKLVRDTDTGVKLAEDIKDLEALMEAYKKGIIPEA
ncbi:MAG: fructose-bisphosphatase class III, partial [Lachnospiraceae bacterium]|nr:fructose-bisphosphatase class III [Lachnospiraceae bacterium]